MDVFQESASVIATKLGRVAGIENREMFAIETRNSAFGRKPEVAISGLQDGLNGILRKAAFGVPGLPS